MRAVIRVVIADDHNIVRAGIRELLADEPDIEVVGEARNGQEAVELALRQRPAVVVMDINMPVLSGVEATRQIHAAAPEVRVLVLTAYQDDPYLYGLLDAGAAGYVLKTAEDSEIVRAVRATAAGQSVIDPAVMPRLLARLTRPPSLMRSVSASWRCCAWLPRDKRINRSGRSCILVTARCRTIWRMSMASWGWPRAPRRSPWPSSAI